MLSTLGHILHLAMASGRSAEAANPCPCRLCQLTPTSGLQKPMASRDKSFCTSMKCVHSAIK